jgi:hypothetical protein
VNLSPFAAKENTMKLRLSAPVQRDERVAFMLERHVRGKHGAAPIQTITDRVLGRRLALAYVRA